MLKLQINGAGVSCSSLRTPPNLEDVTGARQASLTSTTRLMVIVQQNMGGPVADRGPWAMFLASV
mgnify:FL=1